MRLYVLVVAAMLLGCNKDKLVPIAPCEPKPEVCDNLDNDCDGIVDNYAGEECDSICGHGVKICANGVLMECNARKPQPEVCNGVDDDCDGIVDNPDSLPVEFCYEGPNGTLMHPGSPCGPGTKQCVDGKKKCLGQHLPATESCNGIDDDCNGAIDDGSGICAQTGRLRVEMTWDVINDVDLHLLEPSNGDPHTLNPWMTNSDCAFYAKTREWDLPAASDNPTLDIDSIEGTGPENITVPIPVRTHIYTIAAHMFSYRAAPDPVNVTIKIYCGGILRQTVTHQFTETKKMWIVGNVDFLRAQAPDCHFDPDGFEFTWSH